MSDLHQLSHWHTGDLAECLTSNWPGKWRGRPHPQKGEVYRVVEVEHGVTQRGIFAGSRRQFLTLAGFPHEGFDSAEFNPVRPKHEPELIANRIARGSI